MSLSLTTEQIERYSRQILVPDFGGKGQIRLRQGRILIIGAGGLGSPSAFYLAAAGAGTLGLIDADNVELSNLQRQILHGTRAAPVPARLRTKHVKSRGREARRRGIEVFRIAA